MNHKVLVIDDNPNNLRLMSMILEDEEYQVFTAMNGLDIINLCHEIQPDIILLDVMMPEISGFEACRILKEDPVLKYIPVIMVTAKTESQDVKLGLEIGAFDYIKKPIDEIDVIARVRSALRYKAAQDKLQSMAMKDGLTNLYNRTLLFELMDAEYEKHLRSGQDIAYMMVDIDYFKKINDTFGHQIGDEVLKELAKTLTANTRKSDIVGRYGGEEFGIFMTTGQNMNVEEFCERIRKSVEDHTFVCDNQSLKLTISIGVCVKRSNSKTTITEMVECADKALYLAKHSGRNRVELSYV